MVAAHYKKATTIFIKNAELTAKRANKEDNKKMAVKVMTKRGTEVTLLNPSEKGTKYADELRNKVRITNDGHLKLDENNKPQYLSKEQKSYRAGYLEAQKDSANCYKAKLGKKTEPKAKRKGK